MLKVSATDVKRQFGNYLDKSIKNPILIEKSGRPAAVLMSFDEFNRLRELELDSLREKVEKAELTGYVDFK